MAILEKEVLVNITNSIIGYYKRKGYTVESGKKELVKIEDLPKGSEVRVTKICDICKRLVPQSYYHIINSRINNKDGLDKCNECSLSERNSPNPSNCVATTHPEFAKLFWDTEDKFKYRYMSHKRINFKCPTCGSKIQNKTIKDIYQYGLSCTKCSDGIKYPEKFMICVLNQLKINFIKELNKTHFNWCSNFKYDFYLPSKDIIIETNGRQHYEECTRGRNLEEEQKNDRIKEKTARKNGIKHYITIDCRKSELEWIKNSILESELYKLFDLSNINWLKCHEFACNTLVKTVCNLWNNGTNVKKIYETLNLCDATIRKYLKQGHLLGWCDYDTKNEIKKGGRKPNEQYKKEIVQLDLNNTFLKEWKTARKVYFELKISYKNISSVCKGNRKTAGGYKWMYKKDYDQYIEQLN